MLVVEIDEKGHIDRDRDYEKKRRKEIQNLDWYFIRINPDKIDFNDYDEFGKVGAQTAKSFKKQTEKSLTDDLLKRLLGLEIKSNHSLKSKGLKWIVKKILPDYKNE